MMDISAVDFTKSNLSRAQRNSVFCDMSDGGGWTVIQRRSDGSENFNRNWNDYENGFRNFVQKNGEYWLGNKAFTY